VIIPDFHFYYYSIILCRKCFGLHLSETPFFMMILWKSAGVGLLLLLSFSCFSQDTLWLNPSFVKVRRDSASQYQVTSRPSGDSITATVRTYGISGHLINEYQYGNYKARQLHGHQKTWHENGRIKSDINYYADSLDGELITYWENGQLRRKDIYEKSRFISGTCYTRMGQDTTYVEYRVMPQFNGGLEALRAYLNRNLKYPVDARKAGIEGSVRVRFIVDKDGSISDLVVTQGHPLLIPEAMRVVQKMPPWIPGKMEGELTKFTYILPVTFRLE
jgi:protein TonB